MGVGVLYNDPNALPPARSPAAPCAAGYVGSGAGLEKEKYLTPHTGLNPEPSSV